MTEEEFELALSVALTTMYSYGSRGLNCDEIKYHSEQLIAAYREKCEELLELDRQYDSLNVQKMKTEHREKEAAAYAKALEQHFPALPEGYAYNFERPEWMK